MHTGLNGALLHALLVLLLRITITITITTITITITTTTTTTTYYQLKPHKAVAEVSKTGNL